nr:cation diffusion facilitator family transporter [uncultured Carboxylicivirga sp.]
MGEHHHHHDLKGRSLVVTILLNVAITLVQVVGAIVSNSLSLLSDALHNFSDVMALIISYVANKLSKKKYTQDKSFGYKRAEIMAAFINAATLLTISFYLIVESIGRIINSDEVTVNGTVVAILAGFSIVANGLSVLLVKKHIHHNMNMRSAYLHLFSDMLSSIAVLIGGLAIRFWNIFWVDALLSVMIAFYLIISSWKLFVGALKVLMQFAPSGVDLKKIVSFINEVEQIDNIHHVHLWQLNDEEIHMEGHLDFKDDISISEANKIILYLSKELQHRFHISHCTLQPEYGVCDDKRLITHGKQSGC